MSKKFIVIKTSGGVVIDVWKDIVRRPTEPSALAPFWQFELLDGTIVKISGEVTMLEFKSGEVESENEYSRYIEYHSSTDTVPYAVRLCTFNQKGQK